MTLLEQLVGKYAAIDLQEIFDLVQIASDRIHPVNRQALKEVTLAQWLLESARGTSKLAIEALNFSGLKWRSEMEKFATPLLIKVPSEPEPPIEFCKFKDVDAFLVGYWKFLTRPPYKGLEDHTKTPETFIGFLARQGFAADPSYVNKVVKLLPEAQDLLVNASRIRDSVTSLPVTLRVIRAPQEVEVGQSFRLEGVAAAADIGKVLLIEVDDRFRANGAPIGAGGKWQFDFVLNQAGDRKIEVSTGNETVAVKIRAVDRGIKDDPETATPSGSIVINLIGSVGRGGVNNREDVRQVKQRLRDLGFTWVGTSNSVDTGTIRAIELFQSIILGRSTVLGDGRIDIGGITQQWLQARNAPRWQVMPKSDKANGFVNFELGDTGDNHDYGTDWLANTILAAAQDYQKTYRTANSSATPLVINNVSLPFGGDTPSHAGHETGLMCDVLLPRKDGDFGGITFRDAVYDQQATRAILRSIRKQKLVRAVFFNDPKLVAEGLCERVTGHDNHIHFEINPPVKQ